MERFQQKIDELCASTAKKLKTDARQRTAFDQWRQRSAEFLKQWPSGWATPLPTVTLPDNDTNAPLKTTFTVESDGSIFFDGLPVDNTRVELELPRGWLSAIQVELIPDDRHGGGILRGTNDSTTITLSASLKSPGDEAAKHLSFYHAEADHKEERYSNGFAIIGVKDAWSTSKEDQKSPQTAVWLLDKPVQAKEGDTLMLRFGKNAAGRLRVSVSPFAAEHPLESGGGE